MSMFDWHLCPQHLVQGWDPDLGDSATVGFSLPWLQGVCAAGGSQQNPILGTPFGRGSSLTQGEPPSKPGPRADAEAWLPASARTTSKASQLTALQWGRPSLCCYDIAAQLLPVPGPASLIGHGC